MSTPRKTRSQGPAEAIDLEHPPTAGQMSMDSWEDTEHFEDEMAFYASYHSNKYNKIIHLIFIPQIWWSWLVISSNLTLPPFNPIVLLPGLAVQPSLAMLFFLGYQFYYCILDAYAGITYFPIMALEYLTATYISQFLAEYLPWNTAFTDEPSAIPFFLAIHVNAWAWQFFGHFYFEGRAPALSESLTQPLVLAPFFVHLEALWSLFKWRPDLHKRIANKASKRIVAMNRAKRD